MNYQAAIDIYHLNCPCGTKVQYTLRCDGDGIYVDYWSCTYTQKPTFEQLQTVYNQNIDDIIYQECKDVLIANHEAFFRLSHETNYGYFKCDPQRMNDFEEILNGTISQGLSLNVIRDDYSVSRSMTILELKDWIQELRIIKQISFFKKRQIEALLQSAEGEDKREIPLTISVSYSDLMYFKSLPSATIEAMLISTIGI